MYYELLNRILTTDILLKNLITRRHCNSTYKRYNGSGKGCFAKLGFVPSLIYVDYFALISESFSETCVLYVLNEILFLCQCIFWHSQRHFSNTFQQFSQKSSSYFTALSLESHFAFIKCFLLGYLQCQDLSELS